MKIRHKTLSLWQKVMDTLYRKFEQLCCRGILLKTRERLNDRHPQADRYSIVRCGRDPANEKPKKNTIIKSREYTCLISPLRMRVFFPDLSIQELLRHFDLFAFIRPSPPFFLYPSLINWWRAAGRLVSRYLPLTGSSLSIYWIFLAHIRILMILFLHNFCLLS